MLRAFGFPDSNCNPITNGAVEILEKKIHEKVAQLVDKKTRHTNASQIYKQECTKKKYEFESQVEGKKYFQAHLLEMSFVFGYISGFHPIHVSDGAILISMMFLCTLDSNGTLKTFLWMIITSTFKKSVKTPSPRKPNYKWCYSQPIFLAKYV